MPSPPPLPTLSPCWECRLGFNVQGGTRSLELAMTGSRSGGVGGASSPLAPSELGAVVESSGGVSDGHVQVSRQRGGPAGELSILLGAEEPLSETERPLGAGNRELEPCEGTRLAP